MHEAAARNGITARFGLDFPSFALDVDLVLPARGVTAIFGPSGSGKTTVLRCVAGLERATTGFLAYDGQVWQDEARRVFVPTHRRPIGVVFQEASLFQHLSVMGNLKYGMTRAGLSPEQAGLDAIVALLGIEHLLARGTKTLSGGERQRIAIARALLRRPRLLLMDEPLAALDLKRKSEILPYLERLHDELDIPILYVSHAPEEVARLADHLVLMDGGKVIAQGPLSETMGRLDLASRFADDVSVVLPVTIGAHDDDDLTRLDFASGAIVVGRRPEPVGRKLRCRIRARDVSLSLGNHADMSIVNILPATVTALGETPVPGHILVETALSGGERLVARITKRSSTQLGIRPGVPVYAQVKAVALFGE
ncbi:molybdenum ABC transporter ATP-binding protein [Rhodoplanes sp. TEM]|uniref:Molybdenum ABC transporter ATP-binding protein n=1 Tax=Rhodoplanes tepidamans TaxID=200616 RepID=A0ABT5J527_RHOTP|nr:MULTISPECIES: molybdenum ABC transporter ATP-binding protein [Rhodoplanes]MDC7784739.1 molybdenum ABC transporter ATP-binding protein [Rhodoplanes tepidamans]MDC7982206.1 molybdenum ABC transporter ATP-binding protein [Rhodoplanes sp. TEM]MDQ0356211.1 molybdate transport system ATP-binding protein [Rhodoplanes tepidamans]